MSLSLSASKNGSTMSHYRNRHAQAKTDNDPANYSSIWQSRLEMKMLLWDSAKNDWRHDVFGCAFELRIGHHMNKRDTLKTKMSLGLII